MSAGAVMLRPEVPVTRETHYLYPSRIFVSAVPTAVTTILGSCVAVCVWDPVSRVGGINHFLLPHWVKGREDVPRFGSVAVPKLIEEVAEVAGSRHRLQAKVFGGASILGFSQTSHLGAQNVEVASRCLSEAGIPTVASAVLGTRGRKLVYQTDDGVALVKSL